MTADPSSPALRPDPIYGTGATLTEKNLARATGLAGAVVVCGLVALTDAGAWAPWQYAVAAVLAFDLVGGVVANALAPAKREHARTDRPGDGMLVRLVRRPIAFSALHVQPILVGLLFPGTAWWWGVAWYAIVLLAVVAVRRVPTVLARPTALGFVAGVALVAPVLESPAGFAWLPVVMALKLVVAHAVPSDVETAPAGAVRA